MFRNYLKIAVRSLWRFRAFSLINLLGLATGLGICLLVLAFVWNEKRYDVLYAKNVYRLCEIQHQESDHSPIKIASTRFPAAPALLAEVPGISGFVRIVSFEKIPLQLPDKSAVTAAVFGTDPSFFNVFGLNLAVGDTATALKEPNSIVLTQRLARNLFGNDDPMGQIISHKGRDTVNYKVTGILPDLPEQSHLRFDALYSISTEERPGWMKDWAGSWAFTYLKLDQQADIKKIEKAFPAFLQKHLGTTLARDYSLFLQPVREIHLSSADITHDQLNNNKFDGRYIPLLLSVAAFVLLLGMINYINLSTARLLTRAKEVGIRKTNGAAWKDIAVQFMSETFLFSIISFLFGFLLVIMLTPLVEKLMQREIALLKFITDPLFLLTSCAMVMITSIAAGLLPAITMARIQPVAVLNGRMFASHRSPLRNVLVIAQFAIAIGLSIAALTVLKQLKFIQQYNLGFNKNAVVVVPVSATNRENEVVFMQELKQVPGVQNITGAVRRIGGGMDLNSIVFNDVKGQFTARCASMFVDLNYLSFYNIPLVAGRDFSADFGADRISKSHIINETLAHDLLVHSSSGDTSMSSLIGQPFRFGFEDSMGSIVGITHDFNFNSLHQQIQPLCITYLHDYFFSELSIKVHPENLNTTIHEIERKWKEFFPSQPFSWYFLDDYLQQLYLSDTQTGLLMSAFTVIAFFISVLGLVGVAAFTIERRTKEIGIRKVLGATVNHIVFLLSVDFIKLVLLSICVAMPAAWWAIYGWLNNFAYHTSIKWWMFSLAGITALLVAALTVCIQSATAARANPVKSLRLE